ncbi:hypothetical protein HDU98_007495 [Podochytrium sp. JEL0797]|nr:hypothetical protein HDU98_007495 [Podochytrium sp. JEL0797]
MCVIFFSFETSPVRGRPSSHSPNHPYRLIAAANRDEFLARPTQPAHYWPSPHSHVIAGTDLVHSHPSDGPSEIVQGTWFGATTTGRFAFITNVRQTELNPNGLSRGFLVSDFLVGKLDPETYLRGLEKEKYNGFNLVVGDLRPGKGGVWYFGNKSAAGEDLVQLSESTIYGLSNGTLVSGREWYKVKRGVASMEQVLMSQSRELSLEREVLLEKAIEDSNSCDENEPRDGMAARDARDALVEALLDILRDTTNPTPPPPSPNCTSIDKFVLPICIDQFNAYGTRTHTVLVINQQWQAKLVEIDRYLVDKSVAWGGRIASLFEEPAEGKKKGTIQFSEQRKEFEFLVEFESEDGEN